MKLINFSFEFETPHSQFFFYQSMFLFFAIFCYAFCALTFFSLIRLFDFGSVCVCATLVLMRHFCGVDRPKLQISEIERNSSYSLELIEMVILFLVVVARYSCHEVNRVPCCCYFCCIGYYRVGITGNTTQYYYILVHLQIHSEMNEIKQQLHS